MTDLTAVRRSWPYARVIPDRVLTDLLSASGGDVDAARTLWEGVDVVPALEDIDGLPFTADPAPEPVKRKRARKAPG